MGFQRFTSPESEVFDRQLLQAFVNKKKPLFTAFPQPPPELSGLRMIGLKFQDLLEVNSGLATAFQCSIGQSQQQVCVRVVGVQFNGSLKIGDRFFVFAQNVVRVSHVQVCRNVEAA